MPVTIRIDPDTKSRSRDLRRNMTNAERHLWNRIRQRQLPEHKFRRQHPIGPYIVDFACLAARLVVEVDGGQHAEQQDYDLRRDNYIRKSGFRVLRFWNNQILTHADDVLAEILRALRPPPKTNPRKGEGTKKRGPYVVATLSKN